MDAKFAAAVVLRGAIVGRSSRQVTISMPLSSPGRGVSHQLQWLPCAAVAAVAAGCGTQWLSGGVEERRRRNMQNFLPPRIFGMHDGCTVCL